MPERDIATDVACQRAQRGRARPSNCQRAEPRQRADAVAQIQVCKTSKKWQRCAQCACFEHSINKRSMISRIGAFFLCASELFDLQ